MSRVFLIEEDPAVPRHGYRVVAVEIEDDPAVPICVRTVRGFGYRFGPV
ncbi:helix-turn-helix domain-containing protein [Sinosporangium siamense]|nr:helix-turn-helix domain-containing protein [Sinosporangium siamense]